MMKKNNKTCICCQKKYTFCLNCSDFDHLPRWMAIYHDENCKKISDVVSNYNFNHITKEQAREILDQCDLSNKENFNKMVKETIDEIYINNLVDEVMSTDILQDELEETKFEFLQDEDKKSEKAKDDLENNTENSEVVVVEKHTRTRRRNVKNIKVIDNE